MRRKKKQMRRRRVNTDERLANVDLGDGDTYTIPAPVAIYIEDLYQEAASLHTRIAKGKIIGHWFRNQPKVEILS